MSKGTEWQRSELKGEGKALHRINRKAMERQGSVTLRYGRERRYVELLWRSGEENSKGIAGPRVEMEKLSRESRGSDERRKS